MITNNDFHFKNRKDAGEQLGIYLGPKYKDLNPLIIGVPRGGIETAWYVALRLMAELTLVVSKKLPLPNQPEYAIGAIAEEQSVYISRHGQELLLPTEIN